MVVYASRAVLLVGVIEVAPGDCFLLVVLSAFGISPPGFSLFELGVAVCFAAGLVP